jgi:hypothetical protein
MNSHTHHRLCHPQTAHNIDTTLASHFGQLSPQQQAQAAHGLISFRESRFFKIFIRHFEQTAKEAQSIEGTDIETLVAYLYGQIVLHKDTSFLAALPLSQKQKSL